MMRRRMHSSKAPSRVSVWVNRAGWVRDEKVGDNIGESRPSAVHAYRLTEHTWFSALQVQGRSNKEAAAAQAAV